MNCNQCAKNFDCVEICKKMVNWQELDESDRIKGKYKPVGIAPIMTKEQKDRLLTLKMRVG